MKSRILFLTILLAVFGFTVSAQSGRNKSQQEKDSRPRVPTERREILPAPTEMPTPMPNVNEQENSEEVIRVESNLIPIAATVTDGDEIAMTNLKLTDFELKIDGETVEIGDLSQTETPVRLALLFDNSSSLTTAREFEKKAALRFLKQVLRPGRDLAALYSISTTARLEQKMTGDMRELATAVENIPPPRGATALLQGIINAAKYLGDFQGRRVIVIISDGDDTISDLQEASLEKVLRAVQVNNCQVYVVQTTDFENFKQTGNRVGSANIKNLTAEKRMLELAAQTGGTVFSPVDEREMQAAFTRIFAELAAQYVINYYPNEIIRGKFRAISLNLRTNNRYNVRTRKGFVIP